MSDKPSAFSYQPSAISHQQSTCEGGLITLRDVTDPLAASDHACVRTLADDAGNRYVLLTTAQYLRLLRPQRIS